MVKFIPNYELQDIDFNNSKGEALLFEKFGELGDEYTIFHSVEWSEKRGNRVKSGESDYLIFNRKYGLLSLEVKHGGIIGKEGEIYQVNRKTKLEKLINPINQADNSTYKFRNIIKSLNLNIPVFSMVWFTGVSSSDIKGYLPLKYLKNGNTFFSEHLFNVEFALETCYKYHGVSNLEIDKTSIKKIIDKIAPEFQAIPSMKNIIEENNYYFNRMTNEQNTLLDYLLEQEEAAIQGAAGTGKTMLAIEKARRLSEETKVVFLCFNRLLVDYLRNQYKNELENVTFTNLNALTAKALRKDRIEEEDINNFLRNIENYPDIWNFHHIIIDEGQDFTDTSIELLKEIAIIQESCFYIFFDKNQVIQQRDNLLWLKDMDCKLLLSRNCRNTLSIAKTSTKPIGINENKLKMRIPIDGSKPNYYRTDNQRQLIDILTEKIKKCTSIGIKKSQITILTTKTIETSVLKDVTKIGNYSITNKPNNKHILFTTSRKFKGLESDVIFIIDIDKQTFYNEENRMVFYVASSRAKSQLELITLLTKEEESEMIKSITASKDGRRIRLQTDLGVNIEN